MRAEAGSFYKIYFGENNLYAGCGMDKTPSNGAHKWVNLDYNKEVEPDILFDLNDRPLPFKDRTFNCIYSSHTLEHVHRENFIYLMDEFHRILKPQGWFVAIVPYGTSDSAWGQIQHNMQFNEMTFGCLDKAIFETEGNYGYKDTENYPFHYWNIASVQLVPFPEFADDPEVKWKAKHLRNVISEMHVVMQRIEE
jgi:SAM-dependent methyltransferase